MDQLVKEFSMVGIAALAVMIVVSMALIRKVLSFVYPELLPIKKVVSGEKRVWYVNRVAEFYNEVGLYFIPYLLAAGFAFIKAPFLYGAIATYGGRFFMAALVATFSGLIVKCVKKKLPAAFGTKIENVESQPGGLI